MAKHGTSTRKRILDLLRREGGQTAAQLATELGVSPSAARQQLALLEAQSLVVARPQRWRAGRPTYLYELTSQADDEFPKAYQQVALSVLDAAADIGGPQMVSRLLVQRRAKLLQRFSAEVADLPLVEKVFRIAEIQDGRGYFAHAERRDGNAALVQMNCPLLEVAKEYPQFCETERELYETATGQPVRLVQSRAHGHPQCCFEFCEVSEAS